MTPKNCGSAGTELGDCPRAGFDLALTDPNQAMFDLETGTLENVRHIRGGDFRFEMCDITSHYEIDEPVDFVYHMASPESPIDNLRLPLHTLKVGAYGTHNTLGLAKAKGAK